MRSILNGALGAGAALLVVLLWQSGASTAEPTREVPAATRAAGSDALPVAVRCAPDQRAVVRQVPGPAGAETEVECVGAAAARIVEEPGGFVALQSPYVAAARPVATAPVVQTRVVEREVAPRRVVEPRRTWKKTALVIGGSAGAGAGVGAIAGGKKGALIGAAIGGGAASIYEAVKRR